MDRRAHAEPHGIGRRVEGKAGGECARHRIGLRRQFAQARRDGPAGVGPQRHPRLAAGQQGEPGLGNGDLDLAPLVPRHLDHRLPGGDHLAPLRRDGGHDPVRIGPQFAIGELVLGKDPALPGCLERFAGGVGRRPGIVERGLADMALVLQRGRAHAVLLAAPGLGFGRALARRFGPQRGGQIRRVEPRDDVAGPHPVADIDQPLGDLAADTEGERNLDPCAHRARKGVL